MNRVSDDAGLTGEQGRRHDGQRGVFAAADGHFTVQRHAAFDQKTFHVKIGLSSSFSSFVLVLDFDYEDDDEEEDDLAIKILAR
jgi:hypothetical protein